MPAKILFRLGHLFGYPRNGKKQIFSALKNHAKEGVEVRKKIVEASALLTIRFQEMDGMLAQLLSDFV
jgi:hypothetical protein